MPARNVALIGVLLLVAVFAALNWSVIPATTTLSLGFTQIQAPLGLLAVRIATWIIAAAYLVLAVALAAFWYLVDSHRMDIGETRNPALRRPGWVVMLFAGWAGGLFLAWVLWGFWMH